MHQLNQFYQSDADFFGEKLRSALNGNELDSVLLKDFGSPEEIIIWKLSQQLAINESKASFMELQVDKESIETLKGISFKKLYEEDGIMGIRRIVLMLKNSELSPLQKAEL